MKRFPFAYSIHPGDIHKTEFMEPLGLSSYRLAKDLHVSAPRVNDLVRGKRSITAETAMAITALPNFPSIASRIEDSPIHSPSSVIKLGSMRLKLNPANRLRRGKRRGLIPAPLEKGRRYDSLFGARPPHQPRARCLRPSFWKSQNFGPAASFFTQLGDHGFTAHHALPHGHQRHAALRQVQIRAAAKADNAKALTGT